MTTIVSDNILSALGMTTLENFSKVKQGISGLTRYEGLFGLPEPFVASVIDGILLENAFYKLLPPPEWFRLDNRYTKLEKAAIVSVANALENTCIDASDPGVLFILSTTKGNIFLLDAEEAKEYEKERIYLWRSAEIIAGFFGNNNTPRVVSNACISGATALLMAKRALDAELYDCVIVVGVDMLSRFIISGFQSFKALSAEICKPFDAGRNGLNIGEAAATIIMTNEPRPRDGEIVLSAGAIRNDANHISGPSRTGEGAYLALQKTLEGISADELAFINAHGTASIYNDEMEAVALTRAGLNQVPVNSLKGYFGHTLGCAGVLESIIATHALREGVVLKTYGFETSGVTHPIRVADKCTGTTRKRCINMLSGFGGCNASILYSLS